MPLDNETVLKLRVLEAKKETYYGIINRIYTYSLALDKAENLKKFKAEYNMLQGTFEALKDIVDTINYLNATEEKYQPNFQVIDVTSQLIGHIEDAAKTAFKNADQQATQASQKTSVKLPKIDLVEFSGDPKKWPLFYETFKNLIHDNSNLDDCSKYHYLVGSLRGKASEIGVGLLPSAANYTVLWKKLIEKYEDKRLLANAYLTQMFTFKSAQNETASCLNAFLEKFDSSVSALKQLKLLDLSDYILFYIAFSRLDSQTQKQFEMMREKSEIPTYSELVEFIKEHSKTLARINKNNNDTALVKPNFLNKQKTTQSFLASGSNSQKNWSNNFKSNKCPVCDQPHVAYQCHEFLKLDPFERHKVVRNKNLCINCLSAMHKILQCKSSNTCGVCSKRHHSLLHFTNDSKESPKSDTLSNNKALGKDCPNMDNADGVVQSCCTSVKYSNNASSSSHTVLLSTVLVNILCCNGEYKLVRFLLDSASQSHFISYKCCQKLRLPVKKCHLTVSGIGGSAQMTKGQVNFTITSRHDTNVVYNVNALVISKITEKLPTHLVEIKELAYLKDLELADDTFYKPGEIEGIIGAELFLQILGSKKVTGPLNLPVAMMSSLGYVVMGKVPIVEDNEKVQSFCCIESIPTLETTLQKFWEVEEFASMPSVNEEDDITEKLFVASTQRNLEGRYIVSLPLRNNPPLLGDSREMAIRRYRALEKRLLASTTCFENYSNVFHDYLRQGHMSPVEESDDTVNNAYYVPHFAVHKDSLTTPLRIVFDASAKTTNSLSLNDNLYAGAKLQTDILTLLLNFRLFKIAMISDVRQMYRNIMLTPEHCRYQRIFWRFSPKEPIKTWQLNTVTFGLKSAPFLALRTIKQLASDEGHNFPAAAKAVQSDIYMDDFVHSTSSVEQAAALQQQMMGLFKAGGFDLVKWSTNCPELLVSIPQEIRQSSTVEFNNFDNANSLKILGLQWNPQLDGFSFLVNNDDMKYTKRTILSTIARIWDPLGFLAPVVLYAKFIMKELWLAKIDWDQELPANIEKKWTYFYKQLPRLTELKVPRHIGIQDNVKVCLIGFADASKDGYGSVVYVKVTFPDQRCQVSFLCAKSKIAPLKVLTVARLELCAASLLAKLIHFVKNSIASRIHINSVILLSDSMVVLNWVLAPAHKWKTFVANRVAKIQALVPCAFWYHVDTKNNAADCLSRGMLPDSFIKNSHWFPGPPWLLLNEENWPIQSVTDKPETATEATLTSLPVLNQQEEDNPLYKLITRTSSWLRLCRIMVYILRFLKILPVRNVMLASDLEHAEMALLKLVQKVHFSKDFKLLKNGECSPNLIKLRPFLQDNLIRVGGRLSNSKLSHDQQHPILLPKKEHLINLLIDHYHRKNFHTGPHLLLSLLRQKYWILSGRDIVRHRVSQCNLCFKYRPKFTYPLMADLPEFRVTQAKPFINTGVDYCGPYLITISRYRGAKKQKAYVCLFICLATRAIHLELASSLSTEAFLAAFKRFLSRRGPCSTLFSDCGTNFVGAKHELDDIFRLIKSKDYCSALENELLQHRIEWKFNSPASPHMGGIWEANVKSLKTHLAKVIGVQILSYEEFSTVLSQIEALLNSRPLSWLSSDPTDPSPLTPAHFLTLTPLQHLPAVDVTEKLQNHLSRKELLDHMVQSFWKRWHLEYLSTLQSRQKWNTISRPIKLGDVVIIKQDNAAPLHWPTGIVEKVFPGKDGIIRIALVRTKHGIYKRPVVRLCPLPSQ